MVIFHLSFEISFDSLVGHMNNIIILIVFMFSVLVVTQVYKCKMYYKFVMKVSITMV